MSLHVRIWRTGSRVQTSRSYRLLEMRDRLFRAGVYLLNVFTIHGRCGDGYSVNIRKYRPANRIWLRFCSVFAKQCRRFVRFAYQPE